MADEYGLSPQQRAFVEHFIVNNNATQAYLAAGYSPNNAGSNASALANRSVIQRAIEALRPKPVSIEDMVTPAYVVQVLKDVAENGETDGAKVQAATQLGRALGLFIDKSESKVSTSFADEIESLQDKIREAKRNAPSLRVVKPLE